MAKARYPRFQGKKFSTWTLVLSMLFVLTVVIFMLLALGIYSLPMSSDDSTPNELTSFRRMAVERYGVVLIFLSVSM